MSSLVVKGLLGKSVIVTGSSSGVGRTTALLFVKHQCRVLFTGRNEEALKAAITECVKEGAKPENVVYVVADLTTEDGVHLVINKAVTHFGAIDVLVNSAGILQFGSTEDTSMEVYDTLFNTNVKSVFQMCQSAIPFLKKSKGCVINVSSVGSLRIYPNVVVYCMTKAALDTLTEGLALELAPYNIRVNSINPGPVYTPMLAKRGDEFLSFAQVQEEYSKGNPLGKICTTEEIGEIITFLASDSASSITGAKLPVDGGKSITSSNYEEK